MYSLVLTFFPHGEPLWINDSHPWLQAHLSRVFLEKMSFLPSSWEPLSQSLTGVLKNDSCNSNIMIELRKST